ncbi:MAG: hypothetical protein ABW166_19305 [Sedimenticola sp.]
MDENKTVTLNLTHETYKIYDAIAKIKGITIEKMLEKSVTHFCQTYGFLVMEMEEDKEK